MELRYTGEEPIALGEWFTIKKNDFYTVIVDARIKIKDPKGAVIVYDQKAFKDLVGKSVHTNGDPTDYVQIWAALNNVTPEILRKAGMKEALPVEVDDPELMDRTPPSIDLTSSSSAVGLVYNYRVSKQVPSIPKSHPLGIGWLEENERRQDSSTFLEPLSGIEREACEIALNYTGFKLKTKLNMFLLCKSDTVPTCFTKRVGGNTLSTKPRLVLNFCQLQGLRSGAVSSAFIAQVITHELAHMMLHDGIFRQSQAERYKKQLAARRLHHDQFGHAGYSNPWYHEAWATLCEYMVHGKSERGLSCLEGWEFAEQYFDNNFLKNGIPTGDPLTTIGVIG